MAIEQNKQVMSRFVDFINTADAALANELIDPDATFYVPGRPEPLNGPAGYLELIAMMHSGFPDIQWTLEKLVCEGDSVAAQFIMRGTHNGSFFGIPATGKEIAVQALNIYLLSEGKVVKEYGHPDLRDLMGQIGTLPF